MEDKYTQLLHIFDREMRKELELGVLAATLDTLHLVRGAGLDRPLPAPDLTQLISNIVDHPEETKYRRIPATNKRLVETVTERKGGRAFLVGVGFHKKVEQNKEAWLLPEGGAALEQARVALGLLGEKRAWVQGLYEAEKRKDEADKAANAQRAAVARQQYEEAGPPFTPILPRLCNPHRTAGPGRSSMP